MEMEQLFLGLSKIHLSLCHWAGVRKERNSSTRRKCRKGETPWCPTMLEKLDWSFLLRVTLISMSQIQIFLFFSSEAVAVPRLPWTSLEQAHEVTW
jgi:hypothetical protein